MDDQRAISKADLMETLIPMGSLRVEQKALKMEQKMVLGMGDKMAALRAVRRVAQRESPRSALKEVGR